MIPRKTSAKPDTNVVPLRRARKPRLTAKAVEAEPQPATRPIMDRAATQRVQLELDGRTALDEIAMLDAVDVKAREAYEALRTKLGTDREEAIKAVEKTYANKVAVAADAFEEESRGRAVLRNEYLTVAARCHAALSVDDAAIAAYRQGLGDGVEQGQQ
jgi:hypothetical protein